ncbi:MAG: cadmium-translocating P-type ATPase [Planctomycetes bacterium]|nr:cadmium-translocating P-type ATPase [Planctomycetota bacterium]
MEGPASSELRFPAEIDVSGAQWHDGRSLNSESPVPQAATPSVFRSKEAWIALGAVAAIAAHVALRYGAKAPEFQFRLPLFAILALGGGILVFELLLKLVKLEFGSDLLAGISIVTSVILGEYLAGAFVVLMLSGGNALEVFAVGRASSVLRALAGRVPSAAHRRRDGRVEDVPLEAVEPGDVVVIFPHEVCPVDGSVTEGHSVMDESYLTGEPFMMSKTPGSDVISGAINGDAALTIRTSRRAKDSRYAKIMRVMRETEQKRPQLRRLGDRLGALYTPIAVAIAVAAWLLAGDPVRFLAVLVIATPCPLLIAIPVAIIGAISLAAKRSIVIRDPAVMERVDDVRTIIFDKTGTLTYGAPRLTERLAAPGGDDRELLRLVASLERYSKHPLAAAIVDAAGEARLELSEAEEMSERPGEGLRGRIGGREVRVTGRKALPPELVSALPTAAPGLECVLLLDGRWAGVYRFHDAPRAESGPFLRHLAGKHGVDRVLLVSGDRESEVAWLAKEVGIAEIHAGKTPEEKVAIVRQETLRAPTLFLGDGINDAPALLAATIGVAFGQKSDVTAEAAGAVIMDASLQRVDEFFHISRRMRRIALQSAVGGILLSVAGMVAAAFGLISPVAGAIGQEVIDLFAVLNALRMALPPRELTDF